MNKVLKLKSAAAILVSVFCLVFFTVEANAQKRRTTTKKTTKTKTPAKTTAPVVTNTVEIKEGAEKVSIQIKNVSKFVYLLGGIARAIEDLDAEAQNRRISQSSVEANNKNKLAVIQGIRNLRAGIAALEIDFRTKIALRTYLTQIQGVTDMVGNAEYQAENGQFTESGKTLLLVIERLTDTLVVLP